MQVLFLRWRARQRPEPPPVSASEGKWRPDRAELCARPRSLIRIMTSLPTSKRSLPSKVELRGRDHELFAGDFIRGCRPGGVRSLRSALLASWSSPAEYVEICRALHRMQSACECSPGWRGAGQADLEKRSLCGVSFWSGDLV